jgi:hypothetical protein
MWHGEDGNFYCEWVLKKHLASGYMKEYMKEYMRKNKGKYYRHKFPERIGLSKEERKEQRIKRSKVRRNELSKTPLGRLVAFYRQSARRAAKSANVQKTNRSAEYLGCSLEDFKKHIELGFKDGMTWDNYGKVWHIDHKMPLALAKTAEDVLYLTRYTNLQPLFSSENYRKNDKIWDPVAQVYVRGRNASLSQFLVQATLPLN